MPGWEPDESRPLVNPCGVLAYYRELLGDQVDLALPDLLVGTFQEQALRRLAERIGGGEPARWPTPVLWPLARGSVRGRPLAVARLPVGAPAAALALELMIAAGVRTVLLVGSAGSLQPHLHIGALAIPTLAVRHEGTSHHYLRPDQPCSPSPDLVDALASAALRRGLPVPALGPTWTTDAPYRECVDTVARMRAEGVLTVEMEAAAIFAVAGSRGVRAAAIVAVSDELTDPWAPGFHTMAFQRALLAACDVALEAAGDLSPSPDPTSA